jgi:energy-coupling factor transport system permease protein
MIKYYDRRTFFHDLDPRVKILWSLGLSLLIVMAKEPWMLFGLFLMAILPLLWVSPPLVRMKAFWILMATIVLGTMVSQGFFYYFRPRTALFTLLPEDFPLLGRLTGGIRLYREGLFYGAVQSLRMLSTLSLGLLLVTTTHPSELIFGLTWLKVPRVLANMVTVAVRFLPNFLEEGRRILMAQQIRGAGLQGLRGRARSFKLMAVPLIIGALKTARQLSLAAEIRGFQGEFPAAKAWRFSPMDRWGLALLVLFLLVFLGVFFSGENSGPVLKWGIPWR